MEFLRRGLSEVLIEVGCACVHIYKYEFMCVYVRVFVYTVCKKGEGKEEVLA